MASLKLLTYSDQPSILLSEGCEINSRFRATEWKPIVWLIRVVICLLAANRGPNHLLARAMDGCMVRCGVIILPHANQRKHFWSRVLIPRLHDRTKDRADIVQMSSKRPANIELARPANIASSSSQLDRVNGV